MGRSERYLRGGRAVQGVGGKKRKQSRTKGGTEGFGRATKVCALLIVGWARVISLFAILGVPFDTASPAAPSCFASDLQLVQGIVLRHSATSGAQVGLALLDSFVRKSCPLLAPAATRVTCHRRL